MAAKRDSATVDEHTIALTVFRERVRVVQMDGQSEGAQLKKEAAFSHRAARAFIESCKPEAPPAA